MFGKCAKPLDDFALLARVGSVVHRNGHVLKAGLRQVCNLCFGGFHVGFGGSVAKR